MKLNGTQIALDLYSCRDDKISSPTGVKDLLKQALKAYGMEEQDIFFNDDQKDYEFSYIVPCNRGHITLHVYPELGFVAADIFTLNENADPEGLSKFLRKSFAPDRAKITFVERGDFGSKQDMKPRRKTHTRIVRRAKNAGAALKRLVLLKPPTKE